MKSKVNVLFYEHSSGYGGSSKSLVNILYHLRKDKFYPAVIIFNEGPQINKIKELGIEIIKFSYKTTKTIEVKNSYWAVILDIFKNFLPITWHLISLIRDKRISLIHINNNIFSGIPAILAAKMLSVPCICHIRQTRVPIKREKLVIPWINKILVLNQKALEEYRKYVPSEKVCLIYNGIDLEEYTVREGALKEIKKEFDLNDSDSIVGIVGRLVEGKGHDDFLKAAAIIENKKSNVKFLIVGDDPTRDKRTKKKLKKLTKNLSLNDDVIFTGWRDDIKDIMSIFDILVMPSQAEGLPNTILEAMALCKPVVATNVSGPSEIVIDGKTGFLIPPNNPSALAEAILKLLKNGELAASMGEAGRKRVERLFDIRKTVRQLEQIYEEILANRWRIWIN